MVRKRTEYRESFQNGDARKLRQSWTRNAYYCMRRRHSEQIHSPLEWEDDDDLSDLESTPRGVPSHVYRHEKYNEAYDERKRAQLEARLARLQLETGGIEIGPGLSVGKADSLSPTVGTPTSVRDRQSPRRKNCVACVAKAGSEVQHVQADGGKIDEDVNRNTTGKRVASKYRKRLPKPRSMSAPLGRSARKQRMETSSPFVSYGSRNKVKETGKKRTHNVRASAEIFPAALRANRRLEMEIKRRQEAAKAAPYSEKRRRALFNYKPPCVWDTEYRDEYAGYDKGLYRHNLYKRHDPRLAWRTYDVP